MICGKCYHNNSGESRYCSQCGAELISINDYKSNTKNLYAGLLRRFGAFCIDSILICSICDFLLFILHRDTQQALSIFSGLVFILYSTIADSSKMQATLGKRAVRIKVTNMSGERISFGKSLIRNICKLVFIYIGFIWITFTKRKQALHDIISSSLVVKC